jgi:hypothetical protein
MATNTLHLIGDKLSKLWFFKLVLNWVSSVTNLQQELMSAVLGGMNRYGVYEESRTNVETVEKPKVSTPVRNQTQFLTVWTIALSEFNHIHSSSNMK